MLALLALWQTARRMAIPHSALLAESRIFLLWRDVRLSHRRARFQSSRTAHQVHCRADSFERPGPFSVAPSFFECRCDMQDILMETASMSVLFVSLCAISGPI